MVHAHSGSRIDGNRESDVFFNNLGIRFSCCGGQQALLTCGVRDE